MKLYALLTALLALALGHTTARGLNSLKDTRVIGGNEVAEGSTPYMVSIQNIFGDHVCGGSIIAPQWILTAGHCMDWPKEYLQIATGSVNWRKPRAFHLVEEVKVHCLFNQPMYHNDIALLRLATPIVFDELTQPIALATGNVMNDGDQVRLTGWGSIKVWGNAQDTLNKVELKYMAHERCEKAVRVAAWLGDGHICSFTKSGEGSCHMDSGGPLVDVQRGEQVGIVNWGEACAIGYPDVYASVSYYHDWIRTTMAGSKSC